MEQTDRQMFVRSPFPPIGDYAFLSDCQVIGAHRAQRQRRVDVPAADGLAERLRRRCSTATRGGFRLGPADVMVPRRGATCPAR